MNMRKNEMGVCPKCGADHTGMTDYEMDLDCLWTKWECYTCGESWSEYATLIYDGYAHEGKVYDAEGKEIFNFGKYKGQRVADVFRRDPGYHGWIQQGDFPQYTKAVFMRVYLNLRG